MKPQLERLDKALANFGIGTRKEVKNLIREGKVAINGITATEPEAKISFQDQITVGGEFLDRREFYYYMIYKPVGCISATDDPREKTVMEYLPERMQNMDLFPIGRLDKDSEGLLIITNDGQTCHRLTSPKHNIWKLYTVRMDGKLDEKDIASFQKGVVLEDGYRSMPADLEILESGAVSLARVRLQEGKFRQIRRMLKMLGKEVTYLKREKMGDLELDPSLAPGEWRELREDEIQLLRNS